MSKNIMRKLMSFLLALALIIGQLGMAMPVVEASQAEVLTITGTGVKTELAFTLAELKGMQEGKLLQYYSTVNKVGTKKLQAGEGIKLSYLLKLAGAAENYKKITFVASDGFKREFTREQLTAPRFYYPNILTGAESEAKAAEVIVALKNGAVTAGTTKDIQLKDIEGNPPIQLMLGQTNFNDINNSLFVSLITKVIVDDPIPESTKSDKSSFKHISYDSAPFNVDSISSATLTIEGPGLVERQIVTIRQLEGMEGGIKKGVFQEKVDGRTVENTYEGITVEYLLNNIVKLKPNAGKVILWDKNLQKISEFSLDTIKAADSKGNKMMIAYGVNDVPLVFTNSDPGYDKSKGNDNGCIKLALNSDQNTNTQAFLPVSRIQVNEKDAKAVNEHSYSPYNKPQYLYDTVTIAGSGMGRETVYSVQDLEAMATAPGSTLGYEGIYSLQNSANYWNNHVLKGVKLYDLLLNSGMQKDLPDSTPVQLVAKDGYNAGPFTLGDIRNSAKYGLYIKGMKDPVKTSLPVLLSYGADGYPFVPLNTDEGFVNGIDNNGGPIRVTFGQKSLEDINGPTQIKYLSRIIIGEDNNYSTHGYKPYDALKDNTLKVKVYANDSTQPIKAAEFKLSDLEALTIGKKTAAYAMVRDYYAVKKGSNFYNDFYQGVGLWYLLKDQVGLPGVEGTITFRSKGEDAATIGIDELNKPNNDFTEYYNGLTGAVNKKPMLAYAKNGYPLVAEKNEADGYVSESTVAVNGKKLPVKNNNGPLAVMIPQSAKSPDGLSISMVDEIIVKLAPDPCSHLKAPYSQYDKTIAIKGSGVKKAVSLKVTNIEEMLDYISKADYYVLNKKGTGETSEYKGIALYDLLRETAGLQPNAEKVKITAEDGYIKEISIQDIIKTDYINEKAGTANLKMLVAYGKNGKPLVSEDKDAGYDETSKNSGGPLILAVGQKAAGDVNSSNFIKRIKEIEVIAGAMTSWKHESAMYQSYLDTTLFRITGSELEKPVTLTLRQLETFKDGEVRDTYTSSQDVAQFEGIDLRYIIEKVAKLKAGVQKPSKITVYSGSKYQRNVDVNQVWDGVLNTKGLKKKIMLGYAREGYPLVGKIGDTGYVNRNDGGPIKLIVEENISMWIKWTDVIVVGNGEYEEPKGSEKAAVETAAAAPQNVKWTLYSNDDNTKLPNASVRYITMDGKGGFWVATYGAGAVNIDKNGSAKLFNKNNSKLQDNTVYDIAVDNKGGTWFTMGGPESAKGAAYIDAAGNWTYYNTENSKLPNNYIHAITLDGKGGAWFATGAGAAHLDSKGNWTVYNKANSLMPAVSVNEITLDRKGGVWFGCYPDTIDEKAGKYRGGYAYLSASGEWTVYTDNNDSSFGNNWVRYISVDKDGGTWVTMSGSPTGGGKVDCIDPQGLKKSYDDKDLYKELPAGDSIRVSVVDTKGGLWLGTIKSGVLYRNAQGAVTAYNSTGKTFPSNKWDNVFMINIDAKGGVWIGTNGGVANMSAK